MMKTFLLKLSSFIVLFFLIDLLLGQVFKPLSLNVKSGTFYNTLYGIQKSHEEILIIGASEVKHSFISNQIRDSLGFSCYNLGLDGNNIYYHYSIFREIIERYTPGIVVISTMIVAEDENTVSSLLPLSKTYRSIKDVIIELAPEERFKTFSNAYIYNSFILNIIQGYVASEPQTAGYIPLYNENTNLKLETRDFYVPFNSRTLSFLSKFLDLATTSGCKAVVVNTPKFFYNSSTEDLDKIVEIVSRYKALYLNYENDTTFLNHSDLFYDGVHLNHDGAELFTAIFTEDLRRNLNLEE